MDKTAAENRAKTKFLLESYRVLDLTDDQGFLCGKVLGDLGADVIKIERPGGDSSRNIRPFYHNTPDPEKSLYWFAFNANKRGITLNIENERGRDIFKRLVQTADFVVESFPPSYKQKFGLGYQLLKKLKPSIIMTSISPFGQNGPYADYKGSNLIAEAMGGLMYITGNPDGRPLSTPFSYAYIHGGLQAATATLVANYWRQSTGQGQHVDVSLQEAVLITLYNPQTLWSDSKVIQRRLGGKLLRHQNIVGGLVYPCKDGYVLWRLMTAEFAPRLIQLIKWMDKEGMAGELASIDWKEFDMSKSTQEQQNTIEHICAKFFLTKTRSELYAKTVEKGIMLFPVYDVTDILQDPQLKTRHFWQEIEHAELGTTLQYPGVPFKINETPLKMKRAPHIGEHNHEIYYKELGISDEELISLRRDNII